MPKSKNLQSCDFQLHFHSTHPYQLKAYYQALYLPTFLKSHQKTFACICINSLGTKVLYVSKAVVIKQLFQYKLWDCFQINLFFIIRAGAKKATFSLQMKAIKESDIKWWATRRLNAAKPEIQKWRSTSFIIYSKRQFVHNSGFTASTLE